MFDSNLLNAAVIIIAAWLASYAITILLSLIGKLTSKTKTNLDDKLIQAVKLPIRYFAVLLGFYYAVSVYDLSWNYNGFGLKEVFYVLIVFLVGFTSSRLIKTLLDWYSKREKGRKINETMFIFVRKVLSVSVYFVAVLFILNNFGIEIQPLLAGLGIMGLAIALGLQETLANLFAALFIVMDKSINVGDWIQLDDGTKAYIEDISWRSVRIRTISGNAVIVPNSTFVGQKISSYDYPESPLSTSISVGVSYDADLDFVEKVAIRAAENILKSEGVKIQENNPIIRFKELADSSINFIIIVKVDSVQDEGRIKHELIKEVVKEFRKENIEIPFPQRVVHQTKS